MEVRKIQSHKELNQNQFRFVFKNGSDRCGFVRFKNASQILKALKDAEPCEDYSDYQDFCLRFANKEVLICSEDYIGRYNRGYFISEIFACEDKESTVLNSNCFL